MQRRPLRIYESCLKGPDLNTLFDKESLSFSCKQRSFIFQSDFMCFFVLLTVFADCRRHHRYESYFQRPEVVEDASSIEEVGRQLMSRPLRLRLGLRRVDHRVKQLPDGMSSFEKYVDDHGGEYELTETRRTRRGPHGSFESQMYSTSWTSSGRVRRR